MPKLPHFGQSRTRKRGRQKSIVDPMIAAIDKRRATLGISRRFLAHRAGISERSYRYAINGHTKKISQRTFDRLDGALLAILDEEPLRSPSELAALHRAAMGLFAREYRLDPDEVIATDFSRQTSANRQWLMAARIRRMAMTVLVDRLGIGKAQLARAIPCTKQNVGQAVAQISDLRDEDGELDAMLDRVGRLLGGAT